nr:mechanosensitive ion channel family protein [Halegenticoccus soli]
MTLAVGVAGQAVIGNLVSGLFLVADPNFNVGDWIAWSGREGTVEAISFRVARIRTPSNEIVSVPNADLTANAVTRPYSRNRYRADVDVAVDYAADVDEAAAILREVARSHPGILDAPAPSVRFLEFGDATIRLRAQFWIVDPTRETVAGVRLDYAGRVQERFEEAEIAMRPAE